jgi:hypothetical protein
MERIVSIKRNVLQELAARKPHGYQSLSVHKLALITVYVTALLVGFFAFPALSDAQAGSGTTYYVSKNGNNTTGLSWHSAWKELAQINWSKIQPGDVILLDGGVSNMTYDTTLTIGTSGSAGNPIVIERSTAAGHNGTITLFGGRSTPLPYCGQGTYRFQTNNVLLAGINLGDHAHIVIDGKSWHGINIYGHNGSGIVFGNNSHDNMIRNMQIYDEGTAGQQSDGSWAPSGPYLINVHGTNQVFQYLDLHDGGEDAFQPSNINDITVQLSWLHDTRSQPAHPGTAFNQCNHNDGMQIWTGNPVSNLTFDQDVVGPEKENGLILGNGLVSVSNVKISNSLFIDEGANNIWGSPATNWTIDHITSFAENQNLIIDGSGHSVTNSIFYGGLMSFHGSLARQSNNCQWQTSGNTLSGQTVNPQFMSDLSSFPLGMSTDVRQSPTILTLARLNFALRSTSPCSGLGSSITSISGFLQTVGGTEANVPAPTPTRKPTHTPTSGVPTQNPVIIATTGEGNDKGEPPSNTSTGSSQKQEVSPWFWGALVGTLILLGAASILLWFTVFSKRKLFRRRTP